MKLFFISKWANWQKYRLEVLTKLAETYDYDIEILTTGKLKPYLCENERVKYKVFKSVFPQKSKFSLMPGILSYILKNKPDVVLSVNNSTQLTEYIALRLCRILDIKFVWWTHGYDHGIRHLPLVLSKTKEKYVNYNLNEGNSIIVFADKGEKYLLSKGISANKIFVAPNTLDTSKLLQQKNELNEKMNHNQILISLNLNPDDKVILFSGQLNKNKKVENAIYACEFALKKIPKLKLVVIGNGSEYEKLIILAKQRIPNNSVFVGDLFDDYELSKWFSIAQLFIMPGYVGLAIIHAFCFGLPFITENLDYHSPEIHFLKNGENGYMVKENDIVELSERIVELIVDPRKREYFSERALETIKNKGDIYYMIEQMNNAILQ